MTKERILITGINGLIGKILTPNLTNTYEIFGIDLQGPFNNHVFSCDISNWSQLYAICQKLPSINYIIHLAADSRVKADWESVLSANIIGTKNIYEVARIFKIKKVIFASSNHVTGAYEGLPQPGMAWAARKEILTDIGFYDANIVGGGDSTISHTLFNDEKYLSSRMSEAHFSHYNIWGKKLFAKVNFQFDYLNTDIYHLWHGSLKNRLYRERLSWLIEADFNPYHDICLTDSGCWQWSSEKPDLHQKIAEYFEIRAEDG